MRHSRALLPLFCLGCTLFVALSTGLSLVSAAEPITLQNYVAPAANTPDEPMAKAFSMARATEFLDSAALDWQKTRGCMTCHTNYAYLMARPAVSAAAPAHAEVRKFAEQLVTERWPDKGPRWDAEVVATATVLALNDAATTGQLQDVTRQALDKMWTLQREDGGWTWIKCDWPPMESDDHFGVTFAAVGVGAAPAGYADTPAAKAGMEKLRNYLRENPAPTLHHKAMILWGASYTPNLMSDADKQDCIASLRKLQHEDGGWGLATLGDWQRGDGSAQDTASSDGYGTGFVIYVLRRAGVPANDAQLQRGVAWLRTHQRESGRWFSRSLHADSKHYITHAGTAFAVLALAACDATE